MPRPKTIIVNDSSVLAAIRACFAADCRDLAEDIAQAQAAYDGIGDGDGGRYEAWKFLCGLQRELEGTQTTGIPYDLPRFAGRGLTPSERIRHQEAVRRLEAAGKVERYRNSIRPTPTEGKADASP